MNLEKEIERAVYYQASLDTQILKNTEGINHIIELVKDEIKKGDYDFSKLNSMVLNQSGKKRFVKLYPNTFSAENILCYCIKQLLDRTFKIKYPNRNNTITDLFNILTAVKQMSNFTIVKFDFKDYFNSVSAIYVYEKILKDNLNKRIEADIIRDFTFKTRYTYAGLRTSNVLAELIAKQFDEEIEKTFFQKGLLFYKRYIDDSILILNQNMTETDIKKILDNILSSVYHDATVKNITKCKTVFNDKKFKYISKEMISETPVNVDFLGYEFTFSLNGSVVDLKYGITKEKREKYFKRLRNLVQCYCSILTSTDYRNLELLRHRVAAFSSRTVYLNTHFNSNIWKVKGIISNYGELRCFLGTGLIQKDTENFLKNMIKDVFIEANLNPYFLEVNQEKRYNLFENMKTNRTILLVDKIGYDYNSLVKLCAKVGIKNYDSHGKKRGYGTLVRDYLIKIKVGY